MPTLDINATNIISAAAVIAAVAFLVRTGFFALRMTAKIDQLISVLAQIAIQFKSNGGSTLLDRIVALEKHMIAQDVQLSLITEQLNRLATKRAE